MFKEIIGYSSYDEFDKDDCMYIFDNIPALKNKKIVFIDGADHIDNYINEDVQCIDEVAIDEYLTDNQLLSTDNFADVIEWIFKEYCNNDFNIDIRKVDNNLELWGVEYNGSFKKHWNDFYIVDKDITDEKIVKEVVNG